MTSYRVAGFDWISAIASEASCVGECVVGVGLASDSASVQSFFSVGGFQQCLRISWSQTQPRAPGGVRNDKGFCTVIVLTI